MCKSSTTSPRSGARQDPPHAQTHLSFHTLSLTNAFHTHPHPFTFTHISTLSYTHPHTVVVCARHLERKLARKFHVDRRPSRRLGASLCTAFVPWHGFFGRAAQGLGHIACPARNHEDGGIVVAALHALRERTPSPVTSAGWSSMWSFGAPLHASRKLGRK